ncbi:MAG TPA: hypothetical protein VKF15_00415 [Nitrososphaerales archaeon]|nr:hypothetical protein [Nitrososphaerales archaeon]
MRTFHLKAVEYQGKRYTNCSLVLDADALKAEIKKPAGVLSRAMVPLANLTWGRETSVQVEGAVVRSGPVTLVADDIKAAEEISRVLNGEAVGAGRLATRLGALKDQMSAFLRMRAEGIAFLVELRNDPRQALVDKSSSFTGRYENPALEYLMKFAATLAEAHAKMTYAAAEVQESVGTEAVDRIFAFVCATGALQDSFVSGAGLSEEIGAFMEELRLDSEPISAPNAKEGTEAMLRRSGPLFSPPSSIQS